ncbi:MAG: hypothetical protein QXO22_07160 [Thermosphaera sp.]
MVSVQQRILSILRDFAKRGLKFSGVSIAHVVLNYEVEYGGHKRSFFKVRVRPRVRT